MIVVNGSLGEGGGQILRTSIALSSLFLKPVKIFNIRAKRRNPGLQRQHIIAVKILATLTNAEVKGLYKGSMTLEYIPKERRAGTFQFDIGTAGSISLVLQATLPVMIFAPGKVKLKIRGGTDVPWSPPIDYVRHVFLSILREMGVNIKINVIRRGHYPKGGGIVEVETTPVKELSPLVKVRRGNVLKIEGISHAVKLPKHVAVRQANSAYSILKKNYENIKITIEYYEPSKDPHLGPGSGIVLWAITENSILGADALGERGKLAEIVGKEAAMKLINELKTNMALDAHMGDMIIPFLAVAKGSSRITGSKLTMHTLTNMEVVKMFTNTRMELHGELNSPFKLVIKGLGFSP